MSKSRGVHIVNAPPNGHEFCSLRRAWRAVGARLADWVQPGRSIRLCLAAESAAGKSYDHTRRGYDEIRRLMSVDELYGVPVCRPEMLMRGPDQRGVA